MKRLMTMGLLSTMLAIGGCSTMAKNTYNERLTACYNRVAYTIDTDGNLIQTTPNCSHIQSGTDQTGGVGALAAYLGIGALVAWVLIEAMDNSNAAATPTVQPSNGLVPKSGTQTTSFSNEFYQPTYVPLQ